MSKKSRYKLIDDFKTSKKDYKKGGSIYLTKKGATYLKTINKIQ